MAAAMMNGAPSERIPEPPDPEREARDRREAALARLESRGGHYRLDHPATKPECAKPIIISRKAN